ncbi:Dam family site-specific DNA-(adenine-N6)-methyltransferase [Holdemanella biformis]|uniref:Dam family site-specific DNA-(adenine-N6)-methyltransferase n=1 Tax=Holdemanella biformis TaxID=1735 RepID=UPI002E7A807F|nr:Dam family site-specific DNA-(adenine-N6)-methyltransferase [Holdemanella biformis]
MGNNLSIHAKPILKWAGGKSQMLKYILPLIPNYSGRYIEPFLGGGAVYFALNPDNAIISDSNPELINMYRQVADNVESVITYLNKYKNDKELFYAVREQVWENLPKAEAAARMIFLNKTCFNGLYRVNKKGMFNTPFGNYKNPVICDEDRLRNASKILSKATLVCGDYLDVLKSYAKSGDFVFLDPPYVPVGKYGDFKRYTKEQFYDHNQIELADEVKRLVNLGCYVILTNSNHPLCRELYSEFKYEVVPTRRSISSDSKTRCGEDIIVIGEPNVAVISAEKGRIENYPPTRYMGSKSKLLNEIWDAISKYEVNTVLDLFSGSGIVSYMFKCKGMTVLSNDYMAMSAIFTKAMIENNHTHLNEHEAKELLCEPSIVDTFVSDTFKDLYYTDEDNHTIDILRTNINQMKDEYKQAIAKTALIRACMKKRPRGIFTYTGHRYDDGRKDLKLSFETQFLNAVELVNKAVFNNGKSNKSFNNDAMTLDCQNVDLVYIDPPYYSPTSDNEYVRRYHFVEGIARNWDGVEIQTNTKTKKFKNYPTPFSTKTGAYQAFDDLFYKYKDSILLVSYSSNSLPSKDEMINLLQKYKKCVDVIPINYTYFFGNQRDAKTHRNNVEEYLFLAI